jgi:hypothetical protein
MSKKFIIFINTLFICISCLGHSGLTKITLIAMDSVTHERIAYVNTTVYGDRDTTFLCTDQNGQVTITVDDRQEQYKVDMKIIGYQTYKHMLTPNHTDSIFYAYMRPDINLLGEVKVNGRRRLIHLTSTGFVYDLEKDPFCKAGSLLNALGKVPFVIVDPNNNIKVKGSSNFSVYLNGKPYRIAQTNLKDILQGIPASSISKVEVITNIDGRYDGETGNAILNIITRKQLLEGHLLSLHAGGATQPKENAGVTFMGSKGNINFSCGYDYHLEGQHHQPIEITNNYIDNGKEEKTNLSAKGDGNWYTHIFHSLFSWNIDSLNVLYIDGHGLFKKTNLNTKWAQTQLTDGTKNSSFFHNKSKSEEGAAETNLIYRHLFHNDKNTENFSLGYRYTYNPDIRNFDQYLYNYENVLQKEMNRKTDGGLNEHTFMVDWTIPASSKNKFYVGSKQILRSGHTTSPGEDQNMKYHQDISSLYVSYMGSLWKLNFNASLRWEYTWLKMNITDNTSFKRNDNDFFPHAQITYQINDYNQLALGYSSSIQRPDITILNPFYSEYSTYNAIKGNPNLKYAYTHALNLDYSLFLNNLFISFGLTCKKQDYPIVCYSYEDHSTLIDTYDNIDHNYEFGGNCYMNWHPINKISLTFSGDIEHIRQKSDIFNLNQKTLIYNLTCMSDLTLKRNWNIGVQYGVYKDTPGAWEKIEPISLYSFYLSKSLLKNQLNVRLTINSPFNRYEKLSTSKERDNYINHQNNFMTARAFGIDITYNIKSGKVRKIKRDRSLLNSDQKTGIS